MKLIIAAFIAVLSVIATWLLLRENFMAAQIALLITSFAIIYIARTVYSSRQRETDEKLAAISKKEEIETKIRLLEENALLMKKTASDAAKELESLKTQNKAYEAALAQAKAEQKKAEATNPGEQAVVQFVRSLQERGRFLDFVMADIHALPDQQVGAVARVVHSGLKSLVEEYFSVEAIAAKDEGTSIAIPKDEVGKSYRLLQANSDSIPEAGVLVHKGWQSKTIRLPKSVKLETEKERQVLAFAEVDVKSSGVHG